MKRKILKYPNLILNQVSTDVEIVDTRLLDDMYEVMAENKAVGIAAIQIGVALNVLVIEYEGELIEAINPKIIQSIGIQYKTEGCLSLPNVEAVVERAASIEVEYLNRDGDECSMTSDGKLATIWQHEIEHLRGGLYFDNLSKGKLKRLMATYKKRK